MPCRRTAARFLADPAIGRTISLPQPAYIQAAGLLREWFTHRTVLQPKIDAIAGPRSLVLELVYGTVRMERAIDAVQQRLVTRPPSARLEPFLKLGLYQVLFARHIPAAVAVDQTIKTAKRRVDQRGIGFLNAVLRRAAREADDHLQWLAGQPLAVRTSHPDILVERWLARHDTHTVEAICQWNNTRPPLVIRAFRHRCAPEDLLGAAMENDLALTVHPAGGGAFFTVPRGVRVADIPGYREGWFSVQDPATAHAVNLLDVQPGQTVLDLCAAPGGKTIQIADRLGDDGRIMAVDSQADRVERLRESMDRLQLGVVEIAIADAARPEALTRALGNDRFDRVLVDVPCSNTGVLRRRPEARWRFTKEALAAIIIMQRKMLDSAAGRLAPGGALVYSTCSLEVEENRGLIDAWLSTHPGFTLEEEIECLPPRAGTDSAYAARIAQRA